MLGDCYHTGETSRSAAGAISKHLHSIATCIDRPPSPPELHFNPFFSGISGISGISSVSGLDTLPITIALRLFLRRLGGGCNFLRHSVIPLRRFRCLHTGAVLLRLHWKKDRMLTGADWRCAIKILEMVA